MSLRLTPLGLANIPPPMALHEVNLTQNVVDVAFNDSGSDFAVLHGNSISTYHYEAADSIFSPPTFSTSCDPPIKNSVLRQIRFMNESSIIVLKSHTFTGKDGVLLTNLQLNSFEEFKLDDTAPISTIQPIWRTPAVLWFDTDGGIGQFVIKNGQIEREKYKINSKMKLPSRMQRIETFGCIDRGHKESECYHTSVVALATNGNLYVIKQPQDGEIMLLTKGCTSFVVSFPFLIITTASHFLKFIRFTDSMLLSLSG